MHNAVTFTRIQGQSQCPEAFEDEKFFIFLLIELLLIYGVPEKTSGFCCQSGLGGSRPSVPHGANFVFVYFWKIIELLGSIK